jgi:MYXO-CTERM domain-containing protein
LLAFWPRSARATVAWTATHESGNLSEWTLGPNPTKTLPDGTVRKNVEVLGEQVYSGRYACKITVHPDDTFGQYNQDRVDIQHSSTLTAEGKDSYLSGYFYLPEDAKTRNEILFYETKVSFRNWMDLWIEPKSGGGTTVKFGIESNGANLGSVLLWTGDWSAKQWHQFAIHVHWSTNAQNGVVDVWFDGQPVVTGHKHNTKFDTNAMFFNVGMHRVLPQNFVETIYFDDFIEADTQAEIKIGAPIGSGTDAGTSDAAPSADASDSGAGGAAGAGAAGAAGASSSGTGGASAGSGGGAGGGGESGTAGTGGTGSTGVSTTTTGAQAGAGGATTTGHAAPADVSGCACVVSGTSSAPKRWDAVAWLFAAAALSHRRRRA